MGYLEGLMGKNERIVLVTRQHWITIIGSLLIDGFFALLLIAIGVLLIIVGKPFLVPLLHSSAWIPPAVIILLALLPVWHWVTDWLHWRNDMYVVTNRRIIQIEGVINKHTIDSSLEKINDVVLTQSALGRMLSYGDLEILTGSEIGVNLLKQISEPVRFKTEMLNQKESMGELDAFDSAARRSLASGPATPNDVPGLIAQLDELRKKGLITDAEFEAKRAKLLAQI